MQSKLHPSEKAFQKVCKVLDIKPAKITETFKEVPGASLVIVPNVVLDNNKLYELAIAFGKNQLYETYIYKNLYEEYSSTELYGDGIGAYRTLYIPHKYNVEGDTATNQRKNTKGHVPTVFEAICYWYTLRAEGTKLDFDTTYIRHFDLEVKRLLGAFSRVPYSCVDVGGKPFLVNSAVGVVVGARVAVGSNLNFAPSSEPLSFELEEVVISGVRFVREDRV